eukprot:TRINITY_DN2987_c1_g1_i1.p1 TRINITY_DN2987_c1_g1~~TRINITY_DN2987_c1_g1_i1.p1  ORF type:complete len:410 (+),score=103.27 TRINITY_DN2987_c1_g1_i1:70-1299(+)
MPSQRLAMADERIRVLHLIGSKQDEFYYDLSFVYSRACDSCKDLDRERFEFLYAVVHLDGSWSFPASIGEADVKKAERVPIGTAIERLNELNIDVMVPHMFCVEGMTRYRSLFDLLDIPFLGNHEYTIWPATDKATTKQLLEGAGVSVPKGELLEKGRIERPQVVKVPLVVKPCNEDNSRGLSLVKRQEDLDAAMDYAFSFDERVLVDEYIAGRELRASVIEEEDGTLTVLPKLEYFLEDIRTSAHKLATDKNGKLLNNAVHQAKQDGDRQCPAQLSDVLNERIDRMVKDAHRVLRCRHYSLFDIRISHDEQPYILEACFFCSFSPVSVIPSLIDKSGRDDLKHPKFFQSLLERSAREKRGRSVCHEKAAITTGGYNAGEKKKADDGMQRDVSSDDNSTTDRSSAGERP